MYGKILLTTVCFLLFAINISAEVPKVINYQGYLTDDSGNPVAGESYLVKFIIYDAVSAGTEIWNSGYQPITTTSSLFTYQLGSNVAFPNGIFSDTNRYLGITIGTDTEMSPRIKMSSIAYAYHSLQADSANIALTISDGIVTSIKLADNAITTPKLIDEAVTSAKISEGTIQFNDIGQNSATNGQIIKWNGSAWIADNDNAGSSSNWSVIDSVLYTNSLLGIARGGAENIHIGDNETSMVNFGVACTTSNEAHTTIGGGYNNKVDGYASVISGGRGNRAGIWGNSPYCTIAGGQNNIVTGERGVVSGGYSNNATNIESTVGGGRSNDASGESSTVGGGDDNTASGYQSTIGGGNDNIADGTHCTVGGGSDNTASGACSVVPGGCNNSALADYSFASGSGAIAQHEGSFVWADASGVELKSTVPNQFLIRATGGTKIYSNSNLTAGVTISEGSSAWSVNSDSTLKENISVIDGDDILEKLSQLEITRWNYKSQDASVEHIGPMAQDFHRLFGVGDNNTTITTIDPDGISLAAIKALIEKSESLEVSNIELKEEMSQLRSLVEQLLELNEK